MMKHLITIGALVALALSISTPMADAKGRDDDKTQRDAIEDMAQQADDQADMAKEEVRQRTKQKKAGKKNKGKGENKYKEAMEDVDSIQGDAERRGGRGESAAGLDNAASRGSDKSQEMRARRDERKDIKEAYKADKESNDRASDDLAEVIDDDAAEETANGNKKAKKPWWKFWDD